MRKLGLTVVGAAGLMVPLLIDQANAAPACGGGTTTVTNGQSVTISTIGATACFQAGDKLYNFTSFSSNFPAGDTITFNFTTNNGAHNIVFGPTLTAGQTFTANYEEVVTAAGNQINLQTGDFTQTMGGPSTLSEALTPVVPAGGVQNASCNRTATPVVSGNCPLQFSFPTPNGLTDLTLNDSMVVNANASLSNWSDSSLQNLTTTTTSTTPEPTTLALLSSGLIGIALVRRRRKSA